MDSRIDSTPTSSEKLVVCDNSNPTTSQKMDACETSQATTDNNNDPTDEPTMLLLSSRKRRPQLSIKDKLGILDFAKTSSIRASSKHFNVDRQNIREWMKQEQNLRESLNSAAKRKRRIGGGRKLSNANFDKTLADWVKELRENNVRVSRNMIVARAQQISGNYDNLKHFSASHGWLECFMKRHNFSLRRPPITVAQKVPESHGAIPNGLAILAQRREEKEGTGLLREVEEIDLGEEEVQSDVSIDANC
uniref:HTH CENPB-type domain-containing protein n=1 Tax=Globodera rostochiensis TaxID=31243 RepID=A0A914HTV3_GLORO